MRASELLRKFVDMLDQQESGGQKLKCDILATQC
jgi:hypothetical protein